MKYPFLIFFSAILLFSCRKDSFITSPDATLFTNTDTLSFDTVFTTVGSITESFKIFNGNAQKLRISSVKLSGGSSSPFKMNVDGVASSQVDNVEINQNDSIYVFVQVNVNPSSATLPFILSDSIEINYNGNKKWVQLEAYGQNAIFLKKQRLSANTSWDNKLPYVIIGGLQIDSNATLTLGAGTRVFLHADAPVLVDGSLKVNGTLDEPVVFTGDRLDQDYRDLPASWPGIYFRSSSRNNSLTHAIIKNAYQGIVASGVSGNLNPKVNLSKCRIDNIYDAGLLAINTNLYADNCLISNCGSNIDLESGGDYRFIHCTVASYGTNYLSHTEPVLKLLDYWPEAATMQTFSLKALFQNCIFWGDGGIVDNEISIDRKGSSDFSAIFDHVLYKTRDVIPEATFIASIQNEAPMFDSIDVTKGIFDFHFTNHPNSPAVNAGVMTAFPSDLDDKPRDSKPDIGCYER